MATSLDRLIHALKTREFNLDNQKLLVKSLQCLRDTVGNSHIKETIVNNVNSLIMFRDRYASTEDLYKSHVGDMPKLHTVIYGSPGTGKTLLAKILASIWTSIGLIRKSSSVASSRDAMQQVAPQSPPGERHKKIDMPFSRDDAPSRYTPTGIFNMSITKAIIVAIVGFATFKIISILWHRMNISATMNLSSTEESLAIIIIAVAVTIAISYGYGALSDVIYRNSASFPSEKVEENLSSTVDNLPDNADVQEESEGESKVSFFDKYKDVLDSNRVVVKSPADFIGKFLGFTAEKTKVLLEQSLGKVLFVDEAYGFIPRNDHMFGKEALNEITSFIDKHQGEIVLIFAGYEDCLRDGVFRVQQGLDRRFGLHVTCSGYSKSKLFEMLSNKMTSQGFFMRDKERCFREFSAGKFVYHAGDVDILMTYIKEPLAELYVLRKANIQLKRKRDESSEESGVLDMSSNWTIDDCGTGVEDCDDVFNSDYGNLDEGIEISDHGQEASIWDLVRSSKMITPQIMKDAVKKLNARVRDDSANYAGSVPCSSNGRETSLLDILTKHLTNKV